MTAASPRTTIGLGLRETPDAWARVADYVALTRPRVLSLVLFTAPPAMLLGQRTAPRLATLLGVLLGVAAIGAGSSALNAWWERERDALMERTRLRPLPTGRLTPPSALGFGLALSVLGLVVLYASGGWLPTAIGALTLLHYLGVYTVWLKPRSPQNIVIGGAAGAASPLIASAAVDGTLGLWSVVLFAIVFLWTPPHFWAIALYRKHEYEAAGFPMLPSVIGDAAARRRMLVYAVGLLPVALLPWIAGVLGPLYGASVVVGGGAFVASIVQAIRRPSRAKDRGVFRVSIVFLAALFGAMLIELLLQRLVA